MSETTDQHGVITSRVYARIGLLGNPSDGYNGKCIAISLKNYHAKVVLAPSEKMEFKLNPDNDPLQFTSLKAFAAHIAGGGYYGGLRLLMGTVNKFCEYCQSHNIPLPNNRNFTLSYSTTIPRQKGLSGSSAIVCAALNCLIQHYNLHEKIPVVDRPSLILSVETELGITAGLMDRVIQVYGGMVYMDFSQGSSVTSDSGAVPESSINQQHFKLESMDVGLLPELWLVYDGKEASGEESGKVHSDVRERWLAGQYWVRHCMENCANGAEQGKIALQNRAYNALAKYMMHNQMLRVDMFGKAALGATNIDLVETAESVGAAAKFTGSGGAVVVYCCGGDAQVAELKAACESKGYICERVIVGPENFHVAPAASEVET